jgi:hypothetical protein
MVADVVQCANPVVPIIGRFQSAVTGYNRLRGRATLTVNMRQPALTFYVKRERHAFGVASHGIKHVVVVAADIARTSTINNGDNSAAVNAPPVSAHALLSKQSPDGGEDNAGSKEE